MKYIIALHLLLCPLNLLAKVEISRPKIPNNEMIDQLWYDYQKQELDPILLFSEISHLNFSDLNISQKVKIQYLLNSFSPKKHQKTIKINRLNKSDVFFLAAHRKLLEGNSFVITSKKAGEQLNLVTSYLNFVAKNSIITKEELKSLFHNTPDGAHYRNGYYKDSVRLFLLCRKNRNYPCLFVMKDIFDNFVLDGSRVWVMPALAKSAKNIPSHQTNGHTPVGVHSLDSVMPDIDQPKTFGRFRRVILNWIPKLKNEKGTKSFLPMAQHDVTWWNGASIARDAGRKYLRIHGTGKTNFNPELSYFPHIPTAGCISTREGKYSQREFRDQRLILDKLMEASRLLPTYSNEKRIKGILYVVNIDDQKKPVTRVDLKEYGVN